MAKPISHQPSTASSRPEYEHTNEPKPEIEFEMNSVGTRDPHGGDASTINSSTRDGVLYAEFDPEAGPQLYVPIPDDPEPVILPRTPSPQQAIVIPPDEEPSKGARAWAWIKNKPWLAAAIGTAITGVILILVLCPVLIRSGTDSDPSSPSITVAPGNSSTTSTTSSTSSASATPTHDPNRKIPAKCNNTAIFTQNVKWMGISNAKGEVPWHALPASDEIDCCAQCYTETKEGCQGWWINPTLGNKAPCTIIYGSQGNMPDDECPSGHAYISLAKDPEAKGVGAAGPCGTVQ